jgi:hypothetical protein
MADPRIEELPDDFDETLQLDQKSGISQGPELPPTTNNVNLADLYEKRLAGQNAISDKSFEELMYDMSKTPLFMNEKDVANQSKPD